MAGAGAGTGDAATNAHASLVHDLESTGLAGVDLLADEVTNLRIRCRAFLRLSSRYVDDIGVGCVVGSVLVHAGGGEVGVWSSFALSIDSVRQSLQ